MDLKSNIKFKIEDIPAKESAANAHEANSSGSIEVMVEINDIATDLDKDFDQEHILFKPISHSFLLLSLFDFNEIRNSAEPIWITFFLALTRPKRWTLSPVSCMGTTLLHGNTSP